MLNSSFCHCLYKCLYLVVLIINNNLQFRYVGKLVILLTASDRQKEFDNFIIWCSLFNKLQMAMQMTSICFLVDVKIVSVSQLMFVWIWVQVHILLLLPLIFKCNHWHTLFFPSTIHERVSWSILKRFSSGYCVL